MLLSAHRASKQLGISASTLRAWEARGLIDSIRSPGNVRLYDVSAIGRRDTTTSSDAKRVFQLFANGEEGKTPKRSSYIYCRVSSCKQQGDLDRQIAYLSEKYPGRTLVKDIGSGVNYKRPGLRVSVIRFLFVSNVVSKLTIFYVLSPWSSPVSKEWSRKLLSLTGTDLQESGASFSTQFSKRVVLNWSSTAKNGMKRTLERTMAQSTWQKTSCPLFTFSRAGSTERENMGKNVSEAKEQASYHEIKAIATWYLNERKSSGREIIDRTPAAEALQNQLTKTQHAREENAEKRKRKNDDATNKENEPPMKIRRSKYLRKSEEEEQHIRSRLAMRKPSNAPKKTRQQIAQEKKASEMPRALCFRFFPSHQLASGLKKWLRIARDIDAHVKEIVEGFSQRGEKISFEYLRDEYICLSGKKMRERRESGTLETLREWERRQAYADMPFDTQQEIVKNSVSGCKSAQTNYENGNNTGYELGEKDASARYKTLYFASSGLSVNTTTGQVTMCPKSEFIPKDADRGIYIRDRLVHFLCEKTRLPKEKFAYSPTKYWGNYIDVGKGNGKDGSSFTIRYDTLKDQWFYIMTINCWAAGAPFKKKALEKISQSTDPSARRARQWIRRTSDIFRNSKGNMCSIDPGARVPFTCYDAHRRSFVDMYPDLVGTLANHHNTIAWMQSRASVPSPCDHDGRKRRRKARKTRKREKGRKRKHKRGFKAPYCNRISRIYDRISATTRQSHNILANHLIKTYDVIVLPEFMTMNMVKKRRKQMKLPPIRDRADVNTGPREGGSKLHKTTRKAMKSISHFKFRQRLLSKALADPNKTKDVIITTEEYTTKQCPFCDFVHHKIGSKHTYRCGASGCGFVGGRDCVGAFNIGLRAIVKNEVRAVL